MYNVYVFDFKNFRVFFDQQSSEHFQLFTFATKFDFVLQSVLNKV